ncbi:OTU domain [Sesbania bispinosa]|nr:OTU domain [Sesbania bispinosa]
MWMSFQAKRETSTYRTYVNHTWLMAHKEKFVDAWINKNMHLGTTTTNRVESAHSRLKNMLQDCRGDLCNCWDAMNNMITLQHTEIKGSFQRSIMVVEHRFNKPLYNELRGLVSRNALALIDEKQHINYVGIDNSACGCTLRKTHGLPCACELARYVCMGNHIPITEVHTIWMRLTFNDEGIDEPWLGFSVRPECDEVIRRFELLDLTGKVALKSKMREVAYPETTSMCPPPEKVKKKFPSTLHPFIVSVEDVEADGNCGYRAIAALLGFGEDSWLVIRDDLSRELVHYRDQYIALFGGVDRYNQIRMSLFLDYGNKATLGKWMTLPDMGYVIASRYDVVLVSLSKSGSMTFFPLRGRPRSLHQIICIGYVYGNHFVQWQTSRLQDAEAWEFPYYERMAAFNALFTRFEEQHVPIIIDLM